MWNVMIPGWQGEVHDVKILPDYTFQRHLALLTKLARGEVSMEFRTLLREYPHGIDLGIVRGISLYQEKKSMNMSRMLLPGGIQTDHAIILVGGILV
jgi:hypothetical protein